MIGRRRVMVAPVMISPAPVSISTKEAAQQRRMYLFPLTERLFPSLRVDEMWKTLSNELLERMNPRRRECFHGTYEQPADPFERARFAPLIADLARPLLESVQTNINQEPEDRRRLSICQFGDLCNLAAQNSRFAESLSCSLLARHHKPRLTAREVTDLAASLVNLFFNKKALVFRDGQEHIQRQEICEQAVEMLPQTRRGTAVNVILKDFLNTYCPRCGG